MKPKTLKTERLVSLLKDAIATQTRLGQEKDQKHTHKADALWTLIDYVNGDDEPLRKLGNEE
jgi:hypothetical protein